MTKTVKKITSLFFILLGFTPLLFVLVISIRKHEVRNRMREELGKKELKVVIIPESEVVWMDKNEIWVNNSMFDIATQKLENGVYTFTGLYDEEETVLMAEAAREGGKASENNKIFSLLFKSLPQFCLDKENSTYPILIKENHSSFFIVDVQHQYRQILTPPPRC